MPEFADALKNFERPTRDESNPMIDASGLRNIGGNELSSFAHTAFYLGYGSPFLLPHGVGADGAGILDRNSARYLWLAELKIKLFCVLID